MRPPKRDEHQQRLLTGETEIEVLHDDLDPDTVAAMQEVGPIEDPNAGAAAMWPDNENIDEWLADLQDLRVEEAVQEPQ